MSEVLDQLFEFIWRDVAIPISKMHMSIAHDLVEHKYWGVDGARIESTGLAPTRVHATIPLQSGIVPGRRETWDPNKVYPEMLRGLIVSFSKREVGLLQHPEFGPMVCKAEKLDIDWDAMRRGGCDAEASWVETADDDRVGADLPPSPVSAMTGAAQDFDALDGSIVDLVDAQLAAQGLPMRWPHYTDESFEGLMNKVTGSIDKGTALVGTPKRLLDRVVYRAQQIEEAVDRSRTPLGWPIRHNTQLMIASANHLREQVASADREIGQYRVPADTTLAALVFQIPGATSSVTDLIRLNPDLMRSAAVPANSIARYFGKGAPLAAPYRIPARPVVGR